MAADEFDFPECLARVRAGDDAAARELVERLHPLVVRIARAQAPRELAAEDIVQETFLKVFTHIGQFRGDSPFPHWVARIACRTCLDQHRRRRVRPEIRWSDLSEGERAVFEPVAPADPRPARDSVALVWRLLDTLDGPARLVVTLLDLEGKSVAEACALTGWGASRVKVTAWRARRRLRATARRLRLHEEI